VSPVTGRVRWDGDDLVLDLRGLTLQQVTNVRNIVQAELDGLLAPDEVTRMLEHGTVTEAAEEAQRRLRAAVVESVLDEVPNRRLQEELGRRRRVAEAFASQDRTRG
jgi:hypothetical protein